MNPTQKQFSLNLGASRKQIPINSSRFQDGFEAYESTFANKGHAMRILALLSLFDLPVTVLAGKAAGQPSAFDWKFPFSESPFQPDFAPGYVLIEGVGVAPAGGTVVQRGPHSYPETMTINQPLTLRPEGGPATVGQ